MKGWAKHIGGIAAVWVVVLGTVLLLLRSYSQPSAERVVPSVVGLTQPEAKSQLEELGLVPIWQDSIYAAAGKPGTIVEHHPPAGSSVKKGRKILITTYRITPPSERVAIAEGQDAKIAERILTTRGFKVQVVEEPNRLLSGKAIRVEHRGKKVSDEARFPRGTSLKLVVGAAGSREVAVPWLVGMSLDEAVQTLALQDLAVGHVGYSEDVLNAVDSALAVVVSQDVSPSEMAFVREGTAIDLYLGNH